MTVSMLQIILEIPDAFSLKDKRRVIKSLKDRVWQKYRVSVAEVDLQESLQFSQLGMAMVSNSRRHGERIMHKIVDFVEMKVAGRLTDVKIHTEYF